MMDKCILAVFAVALLGVSGVGQVPDWVADRERIWAELRTQRMTEKSRRLLEKACLEGRPISPEAVSS